MRSSDPSHSTLPHERMAESPGPSVLTDNKQARWVSRRWWLAVQRTRKMKIHGQSQEGYAVLCGTCHNRVDNSGHFKIAELISQILTRKMMSV